MDNTKITAKAKTESGWAVTVGPALWGGVVDPHGTNRAHPIYEQRPLSANAPSRAQYESCWDGVSILVPTTPPQQTASARGSA